MKKRLMIYLAAAFALPSVVYAAASFSPSYPQDVYSITLESPERFAQKAFYNYRLEWNQQTKTFDMREGVERRLINSQDSLPLPELEQQPTPEFYTRELAT